MDGLIKSLPAILSASSNSPEVAEAVSKIAWKHAAGEALSVHARALTFAGNTLVIAVADATWQTQLNSMRDQLLFRLNTVIGKPLIQRLEVRVAATAFPTESRQSERVPSSPSSVSFELLAAASNIGDANLRRAFLGAAGSCIDRLDKQAK